MRFVGLDPAPVLLAFGVLTPDGDGGGGSTARPGVVQSDLAAVPESRVRRMDRYQTLGLAAVRLALSRAGREPRAESDPDWGLILGSSLGSWASNAQYLRELEHGTPACLSPALFARTVPNAVNGEISIAHRIGGVNQTFVSGWSAGGEALVEAAALLAEERVDWVLAGGVEAPDEALQDVHASRRREPATAWLPERLAEGAGVCLLGRGGEASDLDCTSVRAYWRGHDPSGRWSLSEALDALKPLSIGTVLVANTIPPELLRRWKTEAPGARVEVLAPRTGEIGAAGAPAAVAQACAPDEPRADAAGTLIVARGVEGGTAVLVLHRGARPKRMVKSSA